MSTPSLPPVAATLRSLRVTRQFLDRPVDPTLVRDILDVARWTGSGRNRQAWRMVPVTEAGRRAELSRCSGTAGVLAVAPVAVAVAALRRSEGGEDGEFDSGRLVQSIVLLAAERGLGTCPVAFYPMELQNRATQLVGLSSPWRVRMAVALGWPDPDPQPLPGRRAVPKGRLPYDEVVLDPPG